MNGTPKIVAAKVISDLVVEVTFDTGAKRLFDCRSILDRPGFEVLKNMAAFRSLTIDPGGYGISWSDMVDLSEYEIWTKGQPLLA